MRPTTYICALLALSSALPAVADEDVSTKFSGPDNGTHFLVQMTGGVSMTRTGTASVVLGAGGRIGTVRLYALVEASWASAEATGTGATGTYVATQNGADLAAGARVLIPIAGPLRVYIDVLGGGTLASFNLERSGLDSRSSFGRHGLVELAAGLDVRVLRDLSLGVRGKVNILDETPGWLTAMRIDLGRNADLTAGLTVHF
jgi:hypothetical protein